MPRPSAICGSKRFNLLRIVAQQQDAEGRIIVDQDAAFAIEHRAARRDDRNRADAIAFGELRVAVGIDDLQLPEAKQQQGHQAHDDVGNDRQPRLRQPVVVFEPDGHATLRAARPLGAARSCSCEWQDAAFSSIRGTRRAAAGAADPQRLKSIHSITCTERCATVLHSMGCTLGTGVGMAGEPPAQKRRRQNGLRTVCGSGRAAETAPRRAPRSPATRSAVCTVTIRLVLRQQQALRQHEHGVVQVKEEKREQEAADADAPRRSASRARRPRIPPPFWRCRKGRWACGSGCPAQRR